MTGIATQATIDPAEPLVAQAIRGDEAAFATIVRRYHGDMVRVSFVVSGDAQIAEDAVAAAWPIVWQRLRSLREPSRLQPWLCTIAANEARQLARRQERRRLREVPVEVSPDGTSPDPYARVEDLDLAAALARLHPDDRALLALRYVVGLNASELAHAIHMSAPGTRARLARLLARLRKELTS
ncbi:MAG: RNA polymerase sigma factor [Chloroflexota bacterium]